VLAVGSWNAGSSTGWGVDENNETMTTEQRDIEQGERVSGSAVVEVLECSSARVRSVVY
jgi:hypothetical protein